MIGAAKSTIFCCQQRLPIKTIVPVWKAQQERQKLLVIEASNHLKWKTKGNCFLYPIIITIQSDFFNSELDFIITVKELFSLEMMAIVIEDNLKPR